jgi:hypothetical protein
MIGTLDEGGDVLPVSAQLEEQLPDVGALLHEHQKHRFRGQDGYDRVPCLVFEHRRQQFAAPGGPRQFFGGVDDRWDVRGNVLSVEIGDGLTVDEQAIAAEYDGGLDPFTLANGADEVANGGHRRSGNGRAKLEIERAEVKLRQSLELSRPDRYSTPRPPARFSGDFRRMIRRRIIVFLAALAVPVVACQDLASPTAYTFTVADTLRANAFTGTPTGARSALGLYSNRILPAMPYVFAPDGALDFDLVFDIDAAGKPVLIPVSKIATCKRQCQVGLQTVTDSTFDQLTKARPKGYTYDTQLALDIGTPVYIVAKSTACASDLYSNDMYAKLVVDSVHTGDRSVFFRVVTDPNCGFRSLVPGVTPKN